MSLIERITTLAFVIVLLYLLPKVIVWYLWAVPYIQMAIDYFSHNPNILVSAAVIILLSRGLWEIWKKKKRQIGKESEQVQKENKYRTLQRFNELLKLDWREFEKFIASVLKEKGFHTILGAGVKDGGVDVTAIYDEQKYLVQCKHYGYENIGVEKIRELHGVMNGENPPAGGIFVTTAGFTPDAVSEAKKYGIDLWDRNYLKKLVEDREVIIDPSITQDYGTCERCGGKLVLRTAKNGEHAGEQFLGCENYPKCTFIKQL